MRRSVTAPLREREFRLLFAGRTVSLIDGAIAPIPQTVPAGILQQANAQLALAVNSAHIGGAAIAGFLVAGVGVGWAIAVDAATFAVGAAFIAAMRSPAVTTEERGRFFGDLAIGWREFRSRTWLWVIVLQSSPDRAPASSPAG